jgi:hypothetical protein
MQTVVLEPKMQNAKSTQRRNQPQQDNQSKVAKECHERSAKVVGKSLNVNENDVRNQPQQDNQSKGRQECHEGSAKVVGKSLNVNENDVRNQNRPGTEAVKGGQQYHADNKK